MSNEISGGRVDRVVQAHTVNGGVHMGVGGDLLSGHCLKFLRHARTGIHMLWDNWDLPPSKQPSTAVHRWFKEGFELTQELSLLAAPEQVVVAAEEFHCKAEEIARLQSRPPWYDFPPSELYTITGRERTVRELAELRLYDWNVYPRTLAQLRETLDAFVKAVREHTRA